MRLSLIVALLCLIMSTPSFARGTDQHVLGTITAINSKSIEVKTSKGPVDVQVNNKTRYKDQHNPKSITLPEVGDRVIIVATKNEKKGAKKGDPLLVATEIHFSAAKRLTTTTEPVPIE
jgi:hypothetical protein